jgi:hypothetical protein
MVTNQEGFGHRELKTLEALWRRLRICTQHPVNTVVRVIASIFLAEACGKGVIVLVHIIADYGTGDLAFAEVVQRIKVHLPDAEPVPLSVHPFSTLAAGFCIAQLGLMLPRRAP